MAEKRLHIRLLVTDDGNVKLEKASKNIGKMEKKAKTASKSMVKSFAKVGLAVAAAFSVKAIISGLDSVIDRADKIAKTSSKIGIGAEALQELRFAAERSGLSIGELDNNLEQLTRRLGEAVAGTGELKKITDEYGIALLDASGKTRKAEDIIGDLADEIARSSDAAERTRIAYNAFGRSGIGMINALKGGSAGLRDLRQQARDTGNVLDGKLLPGFEQARDAIDTVSGSIRTSFMQAVGEALPAITELSGEILELAKDESFKSFLTGTIGLVVDLTGAVATLGGAIGTHFGNIRNLFAGEEGIEKQLEIRQKAFDEGLITALDNATLNYKQIIEKISREWGGAQFLKDELGIGRKAALPPGAPTTAPPTAPTPSFAPRSDFAADARALAVGEARRTAEEIAALDKTLIAQRLAAAGEYTDAWQTAEQGRSDAHNRGLDILVDRELEYQELTNELNRQRIEAAGEYQDAWQTAEEGRAAANSQALDIIASRELQAEAERKASSDAFQARWASAGTTVGEIFAGIAIEGQKATDVLQAIWSKFLTSLLVELVKAFVVRIAQNVAIGATSAAASASAGGPLAAAAAGASTAATITSIASTAFATALGIAGGLGGSHGGTTFIPKETTLTVDKGQRILSPRQNRDFTEFIKKDKSGGGGGKWQFVFLADGITKIGKLLKIDSDSGRNRLVTT